MFSQVWNWIRSLARGKAASPPSPAPASGAALDYASCSELLATLGIWSPPRPGPRNPTLRRGSREGEPIRGVYLNESGTGLAYFTLNSACTLQGSEGLWSNLPSDQVAEVNAKNRNIYPKPGKEREALEQLFLGTG